MSIAVIGAGLSGLAAAEVLRASGRDVVVFEARSVAGGRIRSVRGGDGAYLADLGPTWVWPAHQPVVRQWMDDLGIEGVAQFTDGPVVVEQGEGPPALMQLPGQDGSVRPRGGPQALIDALVSRLPDGALHLNQTVDEIDITDNAVCVKVSGTSHRFEAVIIAVPPRVAATRIGWPAEMPAELFAALGAVPTWMASQAKAVVLFEKPFWRERGLSGRVFSRVGPLVEVHDHCGPHGQPAALFGFVGVPAAARGDGLEADIRAQIVRCFGEDAPTPSAVHIEDWARDPLVATEADLRGPAGHPTVRPDILRAAHFAGRVAFAGAEVATVSPGLIEGALVAGSHAANVILRR